MRAIAVVVLLFASVAAAGDKHFEPPRGTCAGPRVSGPLIGGDSFYATPGTVEIAHRDLAAETEGAVSALLRDYGLFCPLGVTKKDGAERVIGKATVCEVPVGHECAWIAILGQSPLVRNASLRPLTWGAVFSETQPLRIPAYFGPAPSAQIRSIGSDVLRRAGDFFRKRYQARGNIELGAGSASSQRFLVRGLRGEVIRQPVYWERLEIHTVVSDVRAVHLIVDGYYSPGLGSAEPASDRFEHMDKKYYKELTDYVGGLARALETFFE